MRTVFENNAIVILITILCMPLFVNGQNSFTFKYATIYDEIPSDVVETSDEGFILACSIGQYSSSSYNTLLIRLNSDGDTIRTVHLVKSGSNNIIHKLLKANDGNYFGIGIIENSTESRLWLLKVNPYLDVLLDTTYSMGMISTFYLFGLVNFSNEIVAFGSSTSGFIQNPFIFLLSQSADSLSFKYYFNPGDIYVHSLLQKPDSSGYYMMISGQYQISTNSFGQILTLDTNYNVTDIDSLPYHLNLFYDSQSFNDQQFVLTGKYNYPGSNPRTDKLGILKLDTSFLVNKSNFLGPWDTISYPAYFNNLDFVNSEKIYCGGTCNQAISDFSNNKSYFILGSFDSDLNLDWQKYIGGDMYYTTWAILATSDRGCLMAGCTYDYLTQNLERDVFVVKLDSSGIVTNANGNSDNIKIWNVVVYPNPGSDYLIVDSSPQISGATFILFDMNGKKMLTEKMIERRLIVKSSNWIPGNYIWLVVNGNKIIESGKWNKQ